MRLLDPRTDVLPRYEYPQLYHSFGTSHFFFQPLSPQQNLHAFYKLASNYWLTAPKVRRHSKPNENHTSQSRLFTQIFDSHRQPGCMAKENKFKRRVTKASENASSWALEYSLNTGRKWETVHFRNYQKPVPFKRHLFWRHHWGRAPYMRLIR